MKILMLTLLMGLSSFLSAWQIAEENEVDSSVKEILLTYNEKANMHFSRGEYKIALENYQKVVHYLQENGLSDPSNLISAMCGSMFCFDLLNQNQFAKAAFDELVYEVALLNKKVEEIDWFKHSPVYYKFTQNPNRYVRIEKVGLSETTPEEDCQLQCNGYAVAAAFACGRVPHPAIQFACFGCIFGLEQLCLRCCKGQGFWENCVKALRRLFHDPDHPENPAPHPYE